MQSSNQRIGVIGLGHMGSDFAGNLIADGYQVTVYDRDEKHAAPLVARGATAARLSLMTMRSPMSHCVTED
jgi:3-hydroxyisobutyrate dehydrogenase-like beta-hydroxyacid dehydrogenase